MGGHTLGVTHLLSLCPLSLGTQKTGCENSFFLQDPGGPTPQRTTTAPSLTEMHGRLLLGGRGWSHRRSAALPKGKHAQKPVRTRPRAGMDSGISEEACLSVVIHAHSQFENRSRRKASQGLPLVRCFTGHNHFRFGSSVFARRSPAILRETSEETSY